MSKTQNFNTTFCKNFIGLQRSIGQQKSASFEFQKFIKQQPDQQKKKLSGANVYIGQFYLQISLEEFWSFVQMVL